MAFRDSPGPVFTFPESSHPAEAARLCTRPCGRPAGSGRGVPGSVQVESCRSARGHWLSNCCSCSRSRGDRTMLRPHSIKLLGEIKTQQQGSRPKTRPLPDHERSIRTINLNWLGADPNTVGMALKSVQEAEHASACFLAEDVTIWAMGPQSSWQRATMRQRRSRETVWPASAPKPLRP
jgi:hypothetical protein